MVGLMSQWLEQFLLYDQLGDYETIDGYRLVVQSEMVSINENNNLSFSVSQNSPNPFSSRTIGEF